MALTTSYKVIVSNEDWSALVGIAVEAIHAATRTLDDVQTTDLGGVATFTGLTAGPHLFKVRGRRASNAVAADLSAEGRVRSFSGAIHLQIVAMGNQGITKHYIVDANGMGTHTTWQAACTAATAAMSAAESVVIYINPGTYQEAVVVDASDLKKFYFVGEGAVADLWAGDYASIARIKSPASGRTGAVVTVSGTGYAAFHGIDIDGDSSDIGVAAGDSVHLEFRNSRIATSSGVCISSQDRVRALDCIFEIDTGRLLGQDAIECEFTHCYLNGDGLSKGDINKLILKDCLLGGTAPAGEYWIEEDGLVVSLDLHIINCRGSATGGAGFVKFGAASAISHDLMLRGNQMTVATAKVWARLEGIEGGVVTDNILEGTSSSDGGTAIDIHIGAGSIGCSALVVANNSIRDIQNGLVVNASATDGTCVFGPNAYQDVGANTAGVPAAEDYQVSLATASCALLDGTIHTDTVAQAVTRGSLIIGNSTPAWDELVIGGAGTVLVCDGTDPSWSSSLALAEGGGISVGGTVVADSINVATSDSDDPYFALITSLSGNGDVAHEVRILLDQSAGADHLEIAGQTASVDTILCVKAVAGENAVLQVHADAGYGRLIMGTAGGMNLKNAVEDGDIRFTVDDGGVDKYLYLDGATFTLLSSTGLIDLGASNLTVGGNAVVGGTATIGSDAVLTRVAANHLSLGTLELGTWRAGAYCFIGNQALDQTAAENYALIQSGAGLTCINAASGQVLYFRIANVTVGTFSGTTFSVDTIAELTASAGVTIEGTKLIDSYLLLAEITKPANPDDGYGKLYMKNDDKFYFLSTGGTEYDLTSGAGDASSITFTPTTAADWDSDADPGDVDDALDQLAERATDLEERGVYEYASSTTIVFGGDGVTVVCGPWFSSTPFIGTVNGNPTSTSVVYNHTSGETSLFRGQVLHNTTKGEKVYIADVNIATNTFTVVANSPDDANTWDNTDALTTASQTNTGRTGTFVDIDVTPHIISNSVPSACILTGYGTRRNADNWWLITHPYEAYNLDKEHTAFKMIVDDTLLVQIIVPLAVDSGRYVFTLNVLGLSASNAATLFRWAGQFSKLVA